nr:2Fe-2S iron-sulfur cluster binding domain-containing protein [Candidatus Delongbacteria bacterium]
GYCKCKITSGGGSLLPTEEPLLNQQERDNQIRLACQVKLKRDMEIEIPEALFAIRQYQAETVMIRDLTYDIKWVRFQLFPPDQIRFKPGQYIQVESQPYGEVREGVSRAYSICSPNTREDQIELMIRLVPGGICTTWVHQVLKTGDRVNLVGPMGDFYLRDGTGEIIMVAGGSGMAPMVSILHDLQAQQISRPVSFFFGARTTRDLFYLEEMAQFERAIPSFRFVPALSNPEPGDNWQGETGLITDVLARALKEKNNQSAQGYLCGSPGMVKACTAVLNQYGVSNERVFFDPFA